MAHEICRHWIPEEEHHSDRAKKLAGITSRLQNVMLTENITADELVGCARVVRRNHEEFERIREGTNNDEKIEAAPSPAEDIRREFFCIFCGKEQREVRMMIAGARACICCECVEICEDVLRSHPKRR